MDLSALVYLLQNRCVTLLNPDSWDDTNDIHFMTLYRRGKKLRSLLAACFSESDETYHHWHVFANGGSGVCVKFDRRRLIAALDKVDGVRRGLVKYLSLDEIDGRPLGIEELPFLKRYAYEHEEEYRVIFESPGERLNSYDIPIPLTAIERVTLSPWMNRKLYFETKKLLRTIPGCDGLKILQSTLISNEAWKEYGETAT
ncbi:DUF2971 domain-containing protein [Ramlibacter ginsenosidimutans]|uniref:DUF2971 domain-containing protein n=1 Tax=Ramlibacter ginsenosidimutans TaxID=502333 RepID=A0A934TTU8_9BURK|nr:DUF2971 domain-containing protein [Ramlibacter ginsenosidimutans]MBK6007268.1 DUF2971 domain-containing protein [Ramlibacter ginsenosidimutans]